MLVGGDFKCTKTDRLDSSVVSSPGKHDSLDLCRLLGRAHLRDVLDEYKEIAEKDRVIAGF